MNLMVEINLNASYKVSSRNNKVNHNSFQNVVKNWLWNGRLPRLLFLSQSQSHISLISIYFEWLESENFYAN